MSIRIPDGWLPMMLRWWAALLQPKGGTVKIIVKQEADTTCVWIVGEDGQTLPHSESNPTDGEGTAYLKDGQQVEVDVEIAAKATDDGQDNYPKATLGEVTEITGGTETKTPEEEAPTPGSGASGEERPGDSDTSMLR